MKRCTLVLSSLLILLLVSPLATAAKRKPLDRTVVTVNDEVILESDIDKFIEQTKSPSFREFYNVSPELLKSKTEIVNFLISEKIIDQRVKKLEITASDKEVDGQIKAITTRNGISLAQLKQRLEQLGTPFDSYRDGLRRQIERGNLVEREIKPNLKVSEEDLKRFYRQQSSNAASSTEFMIAHIFFDKKAKSETPAAERAKTIYDKVKKNPENFDQFVADYSDDESTQSNGGKLGFFPVGSLVTEFRSLVPVTPVGSITTPIETKAGFHIVKVLEKKAAGFESLDENQKAGLRNQFVATQLEEKMNNWMERQKAVSHIRRFHYK